MAGNYWIKFYVEILDDPKMATLPDRLWRRFYELCLIAGRMNNEGSLPETYQLAWTLRMQTDELEPDMQELSNLDLIEKTPTGWIVTNFSKRQGAMTNAERIEKFRKEKHKVEYYCNECVTEVKRNVTQITDNRIDNREQITEQSTDDARTISPIQEMIEQVTHYPPMTKADIDSLLKIEKLNPTIEDIQAAYQWFTDQGKTFRYYSSLIGPIQTAQAKRIQSANTIPKRKKSHATPWEYDESQLV